MQPNDVFTSLATRDTHSLIALCRSGFSAQTFDAVASSLQIPDVQLADVIHVPKSTLTRRKRAGRFNFEESERLYRIIRLMNLATQVLGTVEDARQWMNAPSADFEGQTPLGYADTDVGSREVEAVLDRIADGVIF